jgi:hypothetical protein
MAKDKGLNDLLDLSDYLYFHYRLISMQILSPGDITTKDRRIQIVLFQQLVFVEMREETRFDQQKADFYGLPRYVKIIS